MWEKVILAVLFLLGLALFTAWMTGLVRRYARRLGVLDVPNERSSHTAVTPRGGGLAMVLGFTLGTLLLMLWGTLPWAWGGPVLLASGAVAAVGWVDDLRHVAVLKRLQVQALAALSLMWIFTVFPPLEVELWQVLAVGAEGLLLMVALTNFYNFMDGIDGLAAVEAVFVAVGGALLVLDRGEWEMALWLLALAAVVAGFLVWNWSPAKIFMGDVGSGFLGFLFAAMALLSVLEGMLSFWEWVILLGVFIVDAGVTLGRRMLAGERWYEAHRSHAYQNFSRRTGSHSRVVIVAILVNVLWLFPWAVLARRFGEYAIGCTFLALAPLVIAALVLGAGKESAPANT